VFLYILPEKAIPEMTFTVSGGTLNPTHSLTVKFCIRYYLLQLHYQFTEIFYVGVCVVYMYFVRNIKCCTYY